MTSLAVEERAASVLKLAALWLVGASMRVTLLAVPPMLPFVHRDLALSETAVGVLTSLPVLLLALAAVPGSLLIARAGLKRALLTGLLTIAVFGAARGVGPSAAMLFLATFLMGIGVAVLQPAAPALVNAWFPARVGVATAIYTNGLIVGEIFGAGFTRSLVDESWTAGLALWSLAVLAAAVMVLLLARPVEIGVGASRAWWPNWRDKRAWQIGLIFGSSSGLYFAANAFIPDYLHAAGADQEIGPSLAALNVSQLLAVLPLLRGADRVVGRRMPMIASGLLALVAVAAIPAGPTQVVLFSSIAIGFSTAFILTLSLALPPLLVSPDDVHRLSAAIFTIAYLCAVAFPVIGGAAWDVTGLRSAAFTPCIVGSLLVMIIAASTDLRRGGDARP
jgi:CP family cyanate transporter-like MFS transporter